ncbi:translation initiation factor IF-2 [Candidatus Woesearchaeota archaeon]|nr:translation initiation factor IF-2 [Candidatus Woesearchaeota archaeon]
MAKKDTAGKPAIRSPIVSVLGHVDHGKSSILDAIRGTDILSTEAGAITQAIGASIIPLDIIKTKCGDLLKALNMEFTIPGLLFIDTPGHAAFTTLRKRGGSLADIAILAVDMNEGFKPQTIEAIEILKAAKTPFIIAANKMDLIPGYRKKHDALLADINAQDEQVKAKIDTKLYELLGQFHERFQMNVERFDRVDDYTKQLAIVPCSALKNHGIAELLMVLAGLAQKYFEEKLQIEVSGPAKGTILEVKESQGLGLTADVIIYDGTLQRNDTIVIAGLNEPIVTKVRALLEPNPLAEMRDKKAKFKPVQQAVAATGVKIAAPDMEGALPGMPLMGANTPEEITTAKAAVMAELDEMAVETEEHGIIIKADTLGSLEALSTLLKEEGIPIRKATVGPVSKKDIADAESNIEQDPLTAVILGFNIPEAASTENVKVFTDPVIYKLIDNFTDWKKAETEKKEKSAMDELTAICKVEVLANCIFRQSGPAVVGVEVLAGALKKGTLLMKLDGTRLTTVKEIQQESKSIAKADKGFQVAISLPSVTVGRHLDEHDVFITDLDEPSFRSYKEHKDLLSAEQKELLKQIAEIKRKQHPVWGI